MGKGFKISLAASLALASFIVACRFCRPLADFYSLHLYPVISTALSWLSSPFGFSLQGIVVIAIIALFVVLTVIAARKKWGWKRWLAYAANLLLWTFVWFYMGWCLNYSRSSLFRRTETRRAPYDSTEFAAFLKDYTDILNASYVEDKDVPFEEIESEIKSFYSKVPSRYGLCKPRAWHHAKPMMFRSYQTATGILGFMGPLFSEFHINGEMLPSQLPFTWAHEYSHLMGVSSEDEANWWAWNACMSSSVPAIRYSAAQQMLTYVLVNARRLLSEEGYLAWTGTIDGQVREDFQNRNDYWRAKRNPTLDKVQGFVYDLFLKSNSIPSGIKNYSEVVQMMMNVEYDKSIE